MAPPSIFPVPLTNTCLTDVGVTVPLSSGVSPPSVNYRLLVLLLPSFLSDDAPGTTVISTEPATLFFPYGVLT